MPGLALRSGLSLTPPTPRQGVPALAWRFPTTITPVLKQGGGYWLRAS